MKYKAVDRGSAWVVTEIISVPNKPDHVSYVIVNLDEWQAVAIAAILNAPK